MPYKFCKKGECDAIKPRRTADGFWYEHKKRILGGAVLLALIGFFYLFFYSALLRINKITVSGTDSFETLNAIQQITRQVAERKYFWWPADNYFIFSAGKTEEKILTELNLASIKIEKKFPQTLKIEASEKKPVLIWREKGDYFYVDSEGIVLKAVRQENINYDLPLVGYATTTTVIVGRPVIGREQVAFIAETTKEMGQEIKGIEVVRTTVSEEDNQIYFYTAGGWYVIFSEDNDLQEQIENLKDFWEQKKDTLGQLEYVDLRVKGRIYYK